MVPFSHLCKIKNYLRGTLLFNEVVNTWVPAHPSWLRYAAAERVIKSREE
jgi:hypothetical protein